MGQVIRRLIVLLVVVVAVLVGLDLAAQAVTESALASHVKTATHSRSASASISSFPFLWDAAVQGRVRDVTVVDRGVPAGPLTLDSVEVHAHQVKFDRKVLFNARSVKLTSISSATVTVVTHLTGLEQTVASALGTVVSVQSGDELVVRVAGQTIFSYKLSQIPLIPDCPLQLSQSGPSYSLSCTVSPVPAPVLAALSQS
ncbi:MAG TPA: LmeA family phospholipid-binding protein [Acidimicrobiales bacterium]|nr:LmeA family phospholipid-binding protein [Acidimicrobiales bacterium]